MDKQNLLYPYYVILLNHKNKWSGDISYKNELWKHGEKKQIQKHILYENIA